MHLSIRHYSAAVSWLAIHIPISLTLIIAISGWNQLDIGCFESVDLKLNRHSSDCPTLLVYLSALLVLIVVCHIPILTHHCTVIH